MGFRDGLEVGGKWESRVTGPDCWERPGREGGDWECGTGIFSAMALRNVQREVSSSWTYYAGAQGGGLGQRNIPGSPRFVDGQHSRGGK